MAQPANAAIWHLLDVSAFWYHGDHNYGLTAKGWEYREQLRHRVRSWLGRNIVALVALAALVVLVVGIVWD